MTEPSTQTTCAVFDIDGVLADVRHRLHFVEQRPKDWQGFFAHMDEDPPLPHGLALIHEQTAAGHVIAYLTGRSETHRAVTSAWLDRHGLPHGQLIMRPDADYRPARMFKPQALRRLARTYRVVLVVDDDDAVVTVLQRDGWPVTHATWMDKDTLAQMTLFEAQEQEGRT